MIKQLQEFLKSDHWLWRCCILCRGVFYFEPPCISSICAYIAKIIWNLLPNNSMCVCALHIRWSTLVIHTALLWRGAIWQKLSNTEKMLRAQVITQQNTQTENQNIVTMCHLKKFKKLNRNRKYPTFLAWYISRIYIGDIYQANPESWYALWSI